MDQRFGAAHAFDLSPIGEVVLGGRHFPIPPLTLARFCRLLSFDMEALMQLAIDCLGGDPATITSGPKSPRRWFWRRLLGRVRFAQYNASDLVIGASAAEKRAVGGLCDVALVAIPDLTRETWMRYASPAEIDEIYTTFANSHDWAFIADNMGLDRDVEREPQELETVLVAIASIIPGHTEQSLLATRLEGFYRLAREAERIARVRQEGSPTGSPVTTDELSMVIPTKRDPERAAALGAMFDEARRRAEAEAPDG